MSIAEDLDDSKDPVASSSVNYEVGGAFTDPMQKPRRGFCGICERVVGETDHCLPDNSNINSIKDLGHLGRQSSIEHSNLWIHWNRLSEIIY